MRFLRYNTDQRITVGPFLDKTDGITPEITLTVTSCWLTFMVDTANVPTLILDVAATASGGANDMVHVTSDVAGYYDLELAAANVNYLGRANLSINDVATHCPVFHEFMILPQKVYDSLILGTDNIEVDAIQLLGTAWTAPATAGLPDCNVKEISADATAANNLEAACDGGSYNVGGGAVVAASCTASTPALIADAVCDEAINTGHAVANSVGKILYDNLNAPVATVDTVVDGIATDVAAIDGKIDTMDSILDDLHGTDIPAIKTVVDANGVKLTAIQGKTDMFPVIWFAP